MPAASSNVVSRAAVANTTYDYVIVGGGLTGLVVANRLTEDPSKNVLVIEYGYLDNTLPPSIPGYANDLNVGDMFDINSAPIPFLNNASFPVYIGAVVGGGSWVNGMEYDRGAQADYDAWEALGNPDWGWNGLFPYFKKVTHIENPFSSGTDTSTVIHLQPTFSCATERVQHHIQPGCLRPWSTSSLDRTFFVPGSPYVSCLTRMLMNYD